MVGPAVLWCCLSLVAAAAMAQAVADFYRGRTVTLIVGTAPGGINDISARLVARHLGRFVPGHPTIIIQNMPGAGGLVLANRIYNTAEKDGSVFAKLERAVPQLAIQGDRNANFDPMKFTWLGSLSSYANDAYVLLVNTAHPARTVADLLRPNIRSAWGPTIRRRAISSSPSWPGRFSACMSTLCAAIPVRPRCSWQCSAASSMARWWA